MSQAVDNPPLFIPALAKPRGRRFRRVLMLGGILLLAGVGLCIWKARDPEPVVRAVLFVIPQVERFAPADGREDHNTFRRSMPDLLKTRIVLNAALRDKNVSTQAVVRAQADPIEWLERSLQLDYPSPPILRVALLEGDPQERVVLVNAVCRAFVLEVERDQPARVQMLEEAVVIPQRRWPQSMFVDVRELLGFQR